MTVDSDEDAGVARLKVSVVPAMEIAELQYRQGYQIGRNEKH